MPDILSIGEILIDLIGQSPADSLADTASFDRYPGGSPANMARTAALAGADVAMVGCVGRDGFGELLRDELRAVGVDTQYIQTPAQSPGKGAVPTTVVLLSRTMGTPEFVVFRRADTQLQLPVVPPEILSETQIAHTTSFALSREPARTAILTTLRGAAKEGAQISLDANYMPRIGPDRDTGQSLIRDVCRLGALVKVSLDDVDRIFGGSVGSAEAVRKLHEWGAVLVCLTRGADGSFVSWDGGDQSAEVPVAPVEVTGDATGAGDAFWGGFLTAFLEERSPKQCAERGARVAARKLETTGPLTEPFTLSDL
jgi:fructokinase